VGIRTQKFRISGWSGQFWAEYIPVFPIEIIIIIIIIIIIMFCWAPYFSFKQFYFSNEW